MKTSLNSIGLLLIVMSLVACGAKTDENSAPSVTNKSASTSSTQDGLMTMDQLEMLRRTRTIDKVFVPAAGSSGKGEIMSELRSVNGALLDPNMNVDVYDTASPHSIEELKNKIMESLDRDRVVLIDSGVTADDRKRAGEITLEAVGANVDAAGALITKAPPDKGNGYLLTPIYSKADVMEQVAKGLIPNPEYQSNTPKNLFTLQPENTSK